MSTLNITDAVEAAARAQYDRAAHPGSPSWESCAELERAAYRIAVRPHVAAAAPLIAARALQDAATDFATTGPTEAARRSLEYPAVELQAMACRHTAAQTPVPTAPVGTVSQATGRITGSGTLRRTRSALSALRTARAPQAV
ncbi:hypothetical protein [Kocuria sabuli]|uniref:hypothetical protein n=1 Tax=Kocuria sabuli TaxID=3071448 RepID=UPI0034D61DEB